MSSNLVEQTLNDYEVTCKNADWKAIKENMDADPSFTYYVDANLLEIAIEKKSYEIIEELHKRRVNFHIVNQIMQGITAVHVAIAYHRDDHDFIRYVAERTTITIDHLIALINSNTTELSKIILEAAASSDPERSDIINDLIMYHYVYKNDVEAMDQYTTARRSVDPTWRPQKDLITHSAANGDLGVVKWLNKVAPNDNNYGYYSYTLLIGHFYDAFSEFIEITKSSVHEDCMRICAEVGRYDLIVKMCRLQGIYPTKSSFRYAIRAHDRTKIDMLYDMQPRWNKQFDILGLAPFIDDYAWLKSEGFSPTYSTFSNIVKYGTPELLKYAMLEPIAQTLPSVIYGEITSFHIGEMIDILVDNDIKIDPASFIKIKELASTDSFERLVEYSWENLVDVVEPDVLARYASDDLFIDMVRGNAIGRLHALSIAICYCRYTVIDYLFKTGTDTHPSTLINDVCEMKIGVPAMLLSYLLTHYNIKVSANDVYTALSHETIWSVNIVEWLLLHLSESLDRKTIKTLLSKYHSRRDAVDLSIMLSSDIYYGS